METVAANEKPEEQKMNRRQLAPLALLAIPLLGAGQNAGSIALTDATSEQVRQAVFARRVGPALAHGNWEWRLEPVSIDLPETITGEDREIATSRAMGPPQTGQGCIGANDPPIPDPAYLEFLGGECRYRTFRLDGTGFAAELQCTQVGARQALSATGNYDPKRFRIEFEITAEEGKYAGTRTRGRFLGHYVGDCPG